MDGTSGLVAAAADIAKSASVAAVQPTRHGLTVLFEGEPVLAVSQSGQGVVIAVRAWLGLRFRSSAKLVRLEENDEQWVRAYTESEWHVRGVVADVVDKLTRRSTLQSRLSAGLSGEVTSHPVGRDTGEYWKALAEWGKKTEKLTPADRHFAFMYGQRMERRLPASLKFSAWAARTANQAEHDGFSPPER